jgi:hypothetical protein
MLDISENQIERVPIQISNMTNIEQLYMRHNKIKKLPMLEKCHKLKVGIAFTYIIFFLYMPLRLVLNQGLGYIVECNWSNRGRKL